MRRNGNKGILRLIKDKDSNTGLSAAVLIRNIRPHRRKDGQWYITHSNFTANFSLNCDGFKVRPSVAVKIVCQPTKAIIRAAKLNRQREAARSGSPILT